MEKTNTKALATPGANPETKRIGFFERDFNSLPKSIDVMDELSKYSADDLKATTEDGKLRVKISQFRGVNAHVTRTVSKSGSIFYTCDLYLSNPIKHRLDSQVFSENLYQRLLMINNISFEESEFDIPVRLRFGKGYSEKVKNADGSFLFVEVIFPGIKRIYRDFLKPSEIELINLHSLKTPEECAKQKILPWNQNHFFVGVLDASGFKSLWDLDQPDDED